MNKITHGLAGIFGSLMVAGVAHADHGEISFQGRVLAPTCVVNGGDGNVPVVLPDVNAAKLVRAGDVEGQTPFALQLTGCNHVGRVSTYFEPGPTISPEGRLIVDAGGSSNVELQLLNSGKGVMNLAGVKGGQNSQVVDIVDGKATLNYFVEYYSLGATTPGTVTSRVRYSLDYL
ncbi:type 1 fimbrial protein [Pseudomonas sp. S75]|uniref:fimbrial protein n=1 Tax=unclassified Pseudomonas TaxID=196821 RepID=UPI001903E68D|nr:MULTISPECIES: fimbrial protein [unclassified Pseudomonas]MBJ9976539.1 type 1 fimbrial protein [Pseudomonas sp. S30]MBK0154355.1 type 1 fimbrial protein [Pseudomonas sp. S75]